MSAFVSLAGAGGAGDFWEGGIGVWCVDYHVPRRLTRMAGSRDGCDWGGEIASPANGLAKTVAMGVWNIGGEIVPLRGGCAPTPRKRARKDRGYGSLCVSREGGTLNKTFTTASSG